MSIQIHFPSEAERQAVVPGMDVKLMFEMKHGGERMWVHVTDASERKLTGRLMNTPLVIPRLMADDLITFNRDHIIDIWDDDVSA